MPHHFHPISIRRINYASPVIYNINGQDQIYFSGCQRVFSCDPTNGKELWSVDAPWDVACGIIVAEASADIEE